MHRFQLINKGADRLLVRLEAQSGRDASEVWATAATILRNVLQMNGLGNVHIERSPDAPAPMSKSGKIRQVSSEPA
jgi:hypothetical protein